jgi:DNA-binding response OmpR family regulator
LPDGLGFTLLHRLRKHQNTTPVIIITARGNLEERIKGLDLGADDYLSKPVDTRELIARIRALLRRSSKLPLPQLTIDNLKIDFSTRKVDRAETNIILTSKEYAVLEFLALHHDEVVTRSMLMEHVWSSEFETFSNVIDVYLKNLRKKIDFHPQKKLLHTIRGGGYSLSAKR